jgi:hypothetical protein
LRLRPEPLREAARWLEHYRTFWTTRLDALESFLVSQQQPRSVGRGPRPGGSGR